MQFSSENSEIFNNASMGIVIVDNHGAIQNINPFASRLFGYSPDEIVGKPIELMIPARYHNTHVNYRNGYIQKPSSRPMGLGMDLFAVKKNGIEFPVEISLGHYQNGGDNYIIVFMSDITIRNKAEKEIKKLNDELEAKVESRTKDLKKAFRKLEITLEKEKDLGELKSRFVTMASHEFRTPLSTILSSAYLIEKYDGTEDQPKRGKHIQRIISSVNMLTDILNDFLSVGKIEEGKISIKPVRFNIREVITAISEEIKDTLKKDQRICYQHEGNPDVEMDPSLLKHIVMNLVSNASKFSSEASCIEIKTSACNGSLVLSVKDSGIGISKEDQKHLMERFFRGMNASNIQGTGLGLHIVSKYVQLMEGAVECRSELEKGTEFLLTFNKKN